MLPQGFADYFHIKPPSLIAFLIWKALSFHIRETLSSEVLYSVASILQNRVHTLYIALFLGLHAQLCRLQYEKRGKAWTDLSRDACCC